MFVGADAYIGPLQKHHQPPSQRKRKEKQLNAMTTSSKSAMLARDSSWGIAEENSVPEGKLKSTLAPIRRLLSRGVGHAQKAIFLLDRPIAQPLAALPPYAGQPFTALPCYGCRVLPAGRCGILLAGAARLSPA